MKRHNSLLGLIAIAIGSKAHLYKAERIQKEPAKEKTTVKSKKKNSKQQIELFEN